MGLSENQTVIPITIPVRLARVLDRLAAYHNLDRKDIAATIVADWCHNRLRVISDAVELPGSIGSKWDGATVDLQVYPSKVTPEIRDCFKAVE